MSETTLTEAVRAISERRSVELSEAAQRALSLAKSLGASAPKEYSLPASHTPEGFRGVQLDWAFERVTSLPTTQNYAVK